MKDSLVDYILRSTLPYFIRAWKKRLAEHTHYSDSDRRVYREGYWDGIIDTLQINLKVDINPEEDSTLH